MRLSTLAWLSIPILLGTTSCRPASNWKEVKLDVPLSLKWEMLSGQQLNDIWTRDGREVWAVGSFGTLLHSRDAGETWQVQGTGLTEDLLRITGDDDDLWAISRRTLIRSKDGGKIWERVDSIPTIEEFISLFLDHGAVWVSGMTETLRSVDDGQTWSSGFPRTLHPIFAAGDTTWVLVDSVVLRSTDDWSRWDTVTVRKGLDESGANLRGRWWLLPMDLAGPGAAAGYSSASNLRSQLAYYDHRQGKRRILLRNLMILEADSLGGPWRQVAAAPREYADIISVAAYGDLFWAVGEGGAIWVLTNGEHSWKRVRENTDLGLISLWGAADRLRGLGDGRVVTSRDGAIWTPLDSSRVLPTGDAEEVVAHHDSVWKLTEEGVVYFWTERTGWKSWGSPVGLPFSPNPDEIAPQMRVAGGRVWLFYGDRRSAFSRTALEAWEEEVIPSGFYPFRVFGPVDNVFLASTYSLDGSEAGLFQWSPGARAWTPVKLPFSLLAVAVRENQIWALGKMRELYSASKPEGPWKDMGRAPAECTSVRWAAYVLLCEDSDPRDPGIVAYSLDEGRTWSNFGDGVSLPRSDDLPVFTAGKTVWIVAGRGEVIRAAPEEGTPENARVRLISGTQSAQVDLEFVSRDSSAQTIALDLRFEVGIASTLAAQRNRFDTFGAGCRPAEGIPQRWICKVFPDSVGVRAGEDLQLQIVAIAGNQRIALTPIALTYDPWRWIHDHARALLIGGTLLALLGGALLLLWLWPIWLLWIYESSYYKFTESLPSWARIPMQAFFGPLFVAHSRVLDAWVERHVPLAETRLEEMETTPAITPRDRFVPLPIRIVRSSGSEVMESPSAERVSNLFTKKRALVEIVGSGGTGKTTLAFQFAWWALGERGSRLDTQRMIPIWVDREMTDVVAETCRILQAWLGVTVRPAFAELLLTRGRVLVVVDAVSEKSIQTFNYVRTIHGRVNVARVIVTTRHALQFESGGEARLYPEPLDSKTLLHFVITLLVRSGTPYFQTVEEQLDLGKHLATLFRLDPQHALPITPLLVRLAVEKAVELRRNDRSLAEMPTTIREVVFDYLRGLNPTGEGTSNRMDHDSMIEVALELAVHALEPDFIPKPFGRAETRAILRGMGFDDGIAPLNRLVDNGVLIQRTAGADTMYRFSLDPVAEILAAEGWARRARRDPETWRDLRSLLDHLGDRANGFRQALLLVDGKE